MTGRRFVTFAAGLLWLGCTTQPDPLGGSICEGGKCDELFVSISEQDLPRHPDSPALTLFWAQRHAGIDLARIADTPSFSLGTIEHVQPDSFPGVFDPALAERIEPPSPFGFGSRHGELALAVIVSPLPSGTSGGATVVVSALSRSQSLLSVENQLADLRALFEAGQGPALDVLFASVDFGPFAPTTMVPARDMGTLLFQSAGNDFPRGENAAHDASDATIQVTNVSPLGVTSFSSSESDHSIIGAPAGDRQTVILDGTHHQFGGTSGATPAMAGAMGNVRGLLPGMTRSEARTLLQRTRVPTVLTPRAGDGSLNAYKALRVAQRLETDWPENRARLNEEATYDFSDEAEALFLQSQQSALEAAESPQLLDAVEDLRRAFFLHPEDARSRELLASIYRSSGLVIDAVYYADLGEYSFERATELLSDPALAPVASDLLRYMIRFEDRFEQLQALLEPLVRPDSALTSGQTVSLLIRARLVGVDELALMAAALAVPPTTTVDLNEIASAFALCDACVEIDCEQFLPIEGREAQKKIAVLEAGLTIVGGLGIVLPPREQLLALAAVFAPLIADSSVDPAVRQRACLNRPPLN